ncbi:M28 family peptidase [Myxococcota bacterium]|nr:M28 family peptidase [Myxococcota bacterium]
MTIKRIPGGSQSITPGGAKAAPIAAPAKGPKLAAELARAGGPLNSKNLVKLTEDLAVGFQDRIFGTEQAKKAAEWLASQMKQLGLEPGYDGSYFHAFVSKVADQELVGRNVCGLLRGTDPELSKEVIVVAGHFDSQQDTHVGANDNATGCAGVLAIAEALAKSPPKRSVLFVTFDGEEGLRLPGGYSPGRRGSRFYAENPPWPVDKTALLVNMDELANVHLQSGRRDHIYQWASNDKLASTVLKDAFAKTGGGVAMDGYPEQPREAQFFTTDAEPLFRLGVPTINLLSGRYLENHGPEDDMSLVIPERFEVYAKLAYQCVADAAMLPKSLGELGIKPGGLMPSFPLINEKRASAMAIPEEESFRLWDLNARMPELRKVAKELVKGVSAKVMDAKLADVAGFERAHPTFSEPNLNAIRERWKTLVDAYHEIPKADVAARKEAKKALDLLAGVEGVLTGALYLTKLEATGGYYMQRVPEKLGELVRGARKLGLGDALKGLVTTDDTKTFKAEVSADRAIELARSSLPGLNFAIARSVLALMSPDAAAKQERPADFEDLTSLEVAMTKAAYAALGVKTDDAGDLKRATLAAAFLETTIGKVKGNGDKWIERFAEQNGMLDFAGFVRELGVPGAKGEALLAKATELDGAIFPADPGALKTLVPSLYADLTEVAFGKRFEGVDALVALAKDGGIAEAAKQASKGITAKVDVDAIAAARGDARVQQLGLAHGLLTASLELRQLFVPTPDKKSIVLRDDVSLRDVKGKLEEIAAAASKLEGGDTVAKELSFWTGWLAPFLPVEGTARMQAKARKALAEAGAAHAEPLWPKLAARLEAKGVEKGSLQNPIAAYRALDGIIKKAEAEEDSEKGASPETLRNKVRAEAAMKLVRPYVTALGALETLRVSASPVAIVQLGGSVEELSHVLGDAAVRELRDVAKKLESERKQSDVEVGRKDRGGPMSVLSVRMAQKRD